MSDAPFGHGAAVRTPDRRDFQVGHSQAPVALPTVYLPNRSNIPVKMQGKFGTCGGHAGAMFESMIENLDLSPKYLWKQTKKIYGSPLTEDTGVDMRSIFKALQNTGDCHESVCPDVLDETFSQFSDPSTLTDPMLNDAYPHGVANYAFTDNPSWTQLKQAIFTNGAVIARVDCGDGWYTPSWNEADILPLRLGNYDSGHFVVLWGYDEKYIYFRNSWSTAWGRGGDGYFDVSYLPHVKEIGVGIDAPSLKQQAIFKLQSLVAVLQKIVALLLQGRIKSQVK